MNKALDVFNQAIYHNKWNKDLLNAWEDCGFQSGNIVEAIVDRQEFLERNAHQPGIHMEAVREKK